MRGRPYLEGVRIKKFVYAVPFCLISDARYNEVLGLRFCDAKIKENVPSGMLVGN